MDTKVIEFFRKLDEYYDRAAAKYNLPYNKNRLSGIAGILTTAKDNGDSYKILLKGNYLKNCSSDLLGTVLDVLPELTQEDKDKILSHPKFAEYILISEDGEISHLFESSVVRKMVKSCEQTLKENDYSRKYLYTYDTILSSMSDPFNPTDEEIYNIFLYHDLDFLEVFREAWGDRVLDIAIEVIDYKVNVKKDLAMKSSVLISGDIFNELAVRWKGDINAFSFAWLDCVKVESFYKLCTKDKRYYKAIPKFISHDEHKAVPNNVFNEKDTFDETFRLLMLIAKVCQNREIPKYQAAKLKQYVALIKIHDYKFETIVDTLLDCKDNPPAELPKEQKPAKTKMYMLIGSDGSARAFNTQSERLKALNELTEENPTVKYFKSVATLKPEDEGELQNENN